MVDQKPSDLTKRTDKLKTVKQLMRQRGASWAEKAPESSASIEILAWHAAAELCSMLELTIDVEDLYSVAPRAMQVLRGLESYFKDVGALPPHELAHLLLMVDRVNAGLNARGDDTTRPH